MDHQVTDTWLCPTGRQEEPDVKVRLVVSETRGEHRGNRDASWQNPAASALPLSAPSVTRDDEHVFRKTSTGRWQIRYPGDQVSDNFADWKGLTDLHTLLQRSPRLVKADELCPDSHDPVHAVQTRMRNAFKLLNGIMPNLAAHLEHCKQLKGDSFNYDPGANGPKWILT
jgi:hypothetical protein